MSTPTWQYIAGFMDGEGCINRNFVVVITQGKRDDGVLEIMAGFLRARGVRCTVRYSQRQQPHWLPKGSLEVIDWRSVRKFPLRLMPFLIVKKKRAIEALDYISSKHWRPSLIPKEKLEAARQAYVAGLSFREAEQRFRVSSKMIRRYMAGLGEKGRPRAQATQQWHAKMGPSKKNRLKTALRKGSRRRFASLQIQRAKSTNS